MFNWYLSISISKRWQFDHQYLTGSYFNEQEKLEEKVDPEEF